VDPVRQSMVAMRARRVTDRRVPPVGARFRSKPRPHGKWAKMGYTAQKSFSYFLFSFFYIFVFFSSYF
jgi:hypothetical protein